LLEAGFLLLVLVGGELWEEMLRRLFHRTGPGSLTDTFPSEQTLITLVFLGFAAFLFVRHSGNPTLRFGALLVVLAFSFLVGLSRIYFHIQYPSDVAAGYVFGGVWLSLHIVLLELFRLLRNAKAAG
jgi:membrane-associated phospholipid phosphatase